MAKKSLNKLTEVVSLCTWSNTEENLKYALDLLHSLQEDKDFNSRGLRLTNFEGLIQPIIDLTLLVPGAVGQKIDLVAVVLKGKK